jgi:ubiquinol-cytochrome c reductase core subunit 2
MLWLGHELDEVVAAKIQLQQEELAANPAIQALESVHSVAYHRGLGNPLIPSSASPARKGLDSDAIAAFAKGAYAKPSVAVVANGVNTTEEVSKWVGQFFADVPATAATGPFAPAAAQPSQYFGGEVRLDSASGNAVVIAFPGSSSFGTTGYKPEFSVLAALLGGQSSIKWTSGSSLLAQAAQTVPGVQISTSQATYSDAGLLYVTIAGKYATSVGEASKKVAEALRKVAAGQVTAEDVKRAGALAKFRALETGQNLTTGIEITGSALTHGNKPFQIAQVGQNIEKVTEAQVKEVSGIPFPFSASPLFPP